MFSTEFILAIALVVCTIILLIVGFSSTKRAINQHTKLLKSQAALIAGEQHKVQSDLHRKASGTFETAVAENTDFIKNDLHKTSAEMNSYVEKTINEVLSKEMAHYKASASEIGKVSAAAVVRLQSAIDEQQQQMVKQLEAQYKNLSTQIDELVETEKSRRIEQFEGRMSHIVEAYVNDALTGQIDTKSQLEYIIEQLEQNKKAIVEDMKHVA